MRFTVSLLLFVAPLAYGQSAISFHFDPQVIVPGETATVLLQIQVGGSPSRVAYESPRQPGVEVDMKDDGTGGDRKAGDNVYTISLAAAPILSAMRADDVYRPFVGYFYLYNGPTRVVTGGVNAEVADLAIQRLPVTKDADDVQHTEYIVNILMPQAYPLPGNPQLAIVNRFYELFPDEFDVINVVYVPSFFQNRFHYVVRNAVKGIGLGVFNGGQAYGSPARLQGISVFPISHVFDGADLGFQHEFGHQWINYLNVAPVGSSIPHWPLSTMALGIMGWNSPSGVGSARNFNCVITSDTSGIHLLRNTAPTVFSNLELYLMGLLPPGEVGEQIVLNQEIPDHYCLNDSLYTGTVTRFYVEDLIANAAVGPRVPSVETSQKDFRLATIVVTRDALLDDDAMALYSLFAQRAELRVPVAVHVSVFGKTTDYPFALSTRGLGTMTTRITGTKRRGQLVSQ